MKFISLDKFNGIDIDVDKLNVEQKRRYNHYKSGADWQTAEDLMPQVIADLMKSEGITGITIDPWPIFTEKFGGFRPGEITLLTADTGMGKTAFAVNTALYLVESGKKVLYLSLEDGPKKIMKRIAKMVNGKPLNDPLKDEDRKALLIAMEGFGKNLTFLTSKETPTAQKLIEFIVMMRVMQNIDVVILDHLDCVMPKDFKELGEASAQRFMMRDLHQLSITLGISVLAIQHPNKLQDKGSTKETHRGDRWINTDEIKGSSGFKQFADNIFVFRRPSCLPMNYMQMKFEKIRSDDYSGAMFSKMNFSMQVDCLRLMEGACQDEDMTEQVRNNGFAGQYNGR